MNVCLACATPSTTLFCPSCGTKSVSLSTPCSKNRAHVIPHGAAFCPKCGTQRPPNPNIIAYEAACEAALQQRIADEDAFFVSMGYTVIKS